MAIDNSEEHSSDKQFTLNKWRTPKPTFLADIFIDQMEILSKAWRTKTNKQYQSAWRLWMGWCSSRNVDPFQPSLVEVAEFLFCDFEKNKL